MGTDESTCVTLPREGICKTKANLTTESFRKGVSCRVGIFSSLDAFAKMATAN